MKTTDYSKYRRLSGRLKGFAASQLSGNQAPVQLDAVILFGAFDEPITYSPVSAISATVTLPSVAV